jgi:hypothetical protein
VRSSHSSGQNGQVQVFVSPMASARGCPVLVSGLVSGDWGMVVRFSNVHAGLAFACALFWVWFCLGFLVCCFACLGSYGLPVFV